MKKKLVGYMITGTYQTYFVMAELDNLQTCENFISWELIEMQTWLTPHFNQNIYILFSVS